MRLRGRKKENSKTAYDDDIKELAEFEFLILF